MGFFSKFMKSSFWPLLLVLLCVPTSSQEEGFISLVVSDKGLDFFKDLLIQKTLSSMIPLQLPQIKQSVKIPYLGKADVVLSDITVYTADFPPSFVETGQTGVVWVVSGATAELSLDWSYSVESWFVEVSDHGTATVKVSSMDAGVTAALENKAGTLKLSVLESGCHVTDLSIKMDGGASWFYQGLVDAFEDLIQSAIEDVVSDKIRGVFTTVDSVLHSLPKEFVVRDIAAMNITFVDEPIVSKSSIELDINGLFTAADHLTSSFYHKRSEKHVAYGASSKMVDILLHEKVLDSASLVLFNDGYMQWNVDEEQEQFLSSTSKWKYIIPRLYKMYPNDAMELNFSVSSPPIIRISRNGIESTIYLDVTIDVLDFSEIVPVACIALEITASISPKMVGNSLFGTLELKDFATELKWSKIGMLHISLIKPVVSLILKTVIVPYANVKLLKGLPLPILHGFTLQNAEISCTDTKLVISSDVSFHEQYQSASRQSI